MAVGYNHNSAVGSFGDEISLGFWPSGITLPKLQLKYFGFMPHVRVLVPEI